MKRKRNILILIVITLFIIGSVVFIINNIKNEPMLNQSIKNEETKNEETKSEETKNEQVEGEPINSENIDKLLTDEDLEVLNSIYGLKIENIEVINSPFVGVKGKVFVPKTAILNGINSFLGKTKNDKLKDLDLSIENDSINVYVKYSIMNTINTPIKVNIIPSLNKNNDLVINIREVKVLDLKLGNFFVNLALKSLIKDSFANSKFTIQYENNKITIPKENFSGVIINSISVGNNGITSDILVDAKNLKKIKKLK